jgi:hypothetical protein
MEEERKNNPVQAVVFYVFLQALRSKDFEVFSFLSSIVGRVVHAQSSLE